MLLIEDVDVAHSAKERDDRGKGVSLTGLLNVLDGVLTPHGLIKMLTTNNIDALDPAVIRPGRADVIENVGYLVNDQLMRLLDVLVPRVTEPYTMPSVEGLELTAADVVDVIKQKMHEDPDETIRDVRKMIEQRS
jgi:chaperone BCS1